jgi:hypothetical protein
LVLSFELLMRQIHHRLQQTAPTTRVQVAPTPTAEQARRNAPQLAVSPAAVTVTPATTPSPATAGRLPAKATRSPRAVTQARAEAVRDDCARTGQPLTTTVLAEQLGISAGYARRLLRDLSDLNGPGIDADHPVTGLRAVRP